ncbi:Cysteine desulfurase IscS [bioreactor metagenome]|uniref:Cysteine desulfurase IscS n=1 Tax=bioreactor metagenome TaxID=1076179 RepID=A0A645JQ35_9ZZZZ
MRSGTENTVGISVFAAAAADGYEKLNENNAHIAFLSSQIRNFVINLPGVKLLEPPSSLPSIISMSVPGIKSEVMLHLLSDEGICVSSGSACSSKKGKSSVLHAYGLTDAEADSTIRISLSPMNTEEETIYFCDILANMIKTKWKTIL